MIVCLVTDRRRLAASVGAPPSEYLDVLSEQIAAAAAAGVDFVQIREPDLEARPLTAFIRSVAAKLRGSKTRILVNDRLDVALAAGADGVHLKESSVAPELARSLAPKDFVVACAVHTALTAAARRSADFIVAGTVLPTVSKVRADYLEWRGLAEVIGAANGTPVVGIGGLELASIPSLARTGAAGLAAIGAFIPTSGKLGIDEFVKKRVSDMRFAFDSAQSRP
jgi:thiamine-phosphate pyrophosphorylase